MYKWGSRVRDVDWKSACSKTYRIDSAGLLQGQEYVNLMVVDIVDQLQAVLLDETIPPEAYYWGRGEKKYWPDGELAIGGEQCRIKLIFEL